MDDGITYMEACPAFALGMSQLERKNLFLLRFAKDIACFWVTVLHSTS